jgi:hypothetical protein
MIRVDWSAMTPREVWEALKSAPKVAGPWDDRKYGRAHRIDCMGNSITFDWGGENVTTLIASGAIPRFPDRASADAALRAAGWLLVDEVDEVDE